MALYSLEFWIGVGFIVNFILVILVLVLSRKMNVMWTLLQNQPPGMPPEKAVDYSQSRKQAADDIIQMLEPLMQDAMQVAESFNDQIKEKKKIVRELNDALDNRIININLLLSRADALQQRAASTYSASAQMFSSTGGQDSVPPGDDDLDDQQKNIIDMFARGIDTGTIAEKLGIPKGEVQLVVDLKKKFQAMEKDR